MGVQSEVILRYQGKLMSLPSQSASEVDLLNGLVHAAEMWAACTLSRCVIKLIVSKLEFANIGEIKDYVCATLPHEYLTLDLSKLVLLLAESNNLLRGCRYSEQCP